MPAKKNKKKKTPASKKPVKKANKISAKKVAAKKKSSAGARKAPVKKAVPVKKKTPAKIKPSAVSRTAVAAKTSAAPKRQSRPVPVAKVQSAPVKKAPVKAKAKKIAPPPAKVEPRLPAPPVSASGKKLFRMEFGLKSSPKILYSYVSSHIGLSEWFADDVNIRDGVFIFTWDGVDEKAHLVSKRENQLVRFQWVNHPDLFFEFEIVQDELTSDVALLITDYADEGDMDEAKLLWTSQINALRHVIGS